MSNDMNPNLAPQLKKYLDKTDKERINFIRQTNWIDYPFAKKILTKIEDIFDSPKSMRPRGMLLYGDSNNGKTALLKKFYREFGEGETIDEDGDVVYTMPIVYATASSSSDESRMYIDILSSMNVPVNHNEKVTKKEEELLYYLELMQTKMIIIDEIHSILRGPYNKMTHLMTALKTITNRTGIPIILAGTQDAMSAVTIDNQTKSRFKPQELPLWSNDDNFLRFVATMEAMIPLKKASNLYANYDLLSYIHSLSNGCIGEAVTIIKDASIYAIRNKAEQITKKAIKESL